MRMSIQWGGQDDARREDTQARRCERLVQKIFPKGALSCMRKDYRLRKYFFQLVKFYLKLLSMGRSKPLTWEDLFRPGRSQHDALDALSVAIRDTPVNWILDALVADPVAEEPEQPFLADRVEKAPDRKSTRLNSSHSRRSRMPSSA